MAKTFRKISPALAVLSIAALSLTACGGDKKEAEAPKKEETSSSAPAPEETTESPEETTVAPAPEETTEAPAPEETTEAPAPPAAGGSEASGGDAAACKAVFDTLQSSSSELSAVGSDPKKAEAAIRKVATDIEKDVANISDPEAKAAGQTIAKFFTDVADAAKSQDMSKIQQLSGEISSADSDYMKSATKLGMCMAGQ
ncbi:MAG: hypothetical protein ACTII7_08770 [Galactobacter sp.]